MNEEAKKKKAEYMREYRAKNREKVNSAQREYYKKNKDKIREYQRRYWEKKTAAESVAGGAV